ncbi:Calx-beta domain-containing protein [Kribbella sp. NPDC055071]
MTPWPWAAATLPVNGQLPAWSPDGETIIYNRAGIPPQELFASTASGAEDKYLGKGSHATWAPDAKKVAYVSLNQGLYLMNPDGSGKTHVGDTSYASFPSWSPDGRTLVFSRYLTGNQQESGIYTVHADGTAGAKLTWQVGDIGPVFSPDGTVIAFIRTDSAGRSIYTMRPDGTDVIRRGGLSTGRFQVMSLSWSPDGSKLAFDAMSLPSGEKSVYMTDFDTVWKLRANAAAMRVDWQRAERSVRVEEASGVEGSGGSNAVQVKVGLDAPAARPVKVRFHTEAGTAQVGTDFEDTAGIVEIPVGATSGTAEVPLRGDDAAEPAESFSVHLDGAINGRLADPDATVTIEDDDGPPTVSVKDLTVAEDAPAQATVELSKPTAHDVTVTLQSADSTAVAPGDYLPMDTTVVIPAGHLTATVPIGIVKDKAPEGTETFRLRISGSAGADPDGQDATVTILNDEPGRLIVADATAIENPANAGPPGTVQPGSSLQFLVNLREPTTRSTTFRFESRAGTAQPGIDYAPVDGTLTIPAGADSAVITVPVLDDLEIEPDESVLLQLTPVSDSMLADDGYGTGVIFDDDCPGGGTCI